MTILIWWLQPEIGFVEHVDFILYFVQYCSVLIILIAQFLLVSTRIDLNILNSIIIRWINELLKPFRHFHVQVCIGTNILHSGCPHSIQFDNAWSLRIPSKLIKIYFSLYANLICSFWIGFFYFDSHYTVTDLTLGNFEDVHWRMFQVSSLVES